MHRSLVAAVTLSVCIATLWVAEPAKAQATQSAPPPACETPEHRQFDFWVGAWQVSRKGQDQVIARSLIEKLHAGCVVRESWRSANGAGGAQRNNVVAASHVEVDGGARRT